MLKRTLKKIYLCPIIVATFAYKFCILDVCICLNHLPWVGCDSQFLSRSELSFPFPRLVALSKLKKPICPTVYSLVELELKKRWIHAFSEDISVEQNANNLEFEPGMLSLFMKT